ncbi:DivIVA domain-containing protein [Xylanivirga thermophila]|uniref:DivIVA domain-containing protein n=1 Tax=Xylanivirga thermophila TaxID=2496273 RepID=UPI00101B8DEE|nr:DivIVA domain-containing protein [Xylanivirga thermophila]
MKKLFKNALFGYSKANVDKYIQDMKEDYEGELSKKLDRMMELNEENRMLKEKMDTLEERLDEYVRQESCISKTMLNAEEKGREIVMNARKNAEEEERKLELERIKWQDRYKEIRKQLLEIEQNVCIILENFQSEINYIISQELSQTILGEEVDVEGDIKRVKNVS